MPGNYTHTTRASGTVLTANIYNSDHQNHVNNVTPDGVDDASADVAAMRQTSDPGEQGTEFLATSLRDELKQVRFAIKELKDRFAGTSAAQWYSSPQYRSELVLAKDVTPITVVNTTVETSVFSMTVPGGSLGTDRLLRMFMFGSYLNNSGSGKNLNIRVKYGGVTVGNHGFGLIASSAKRRKIQGRHYLFARDASNAQYYDGEFTEVNSVSSPLFDAAVAVNSAVDQTLEITVQHDVADLNVEIKIDGVFVTLTP